MRIEGCKQNTNFKPGDLVRLIEGNFLKIWCERNGSFALLDARSFTITTPFASYEDILSANPMILIARNNEMKIVIE